PDQQRQAVLHRAAEILEKDRHAHFDTGFVGTPLVLDVLTVYGRANLANRLMNQRDYPGFGHMFAQGATTLWEAWDGQGSHMHPMFGGVCRWFWQALAGIRPDPARPGFEHFFVQPVPVDGVDWVRAEYQSLRGPIRVHWRREAGRLRLDLSVPGNTQCTLTLPGAAPRTLGPGTWSL
ncbi:MAG: hypothetical protein NTY38_12480, partial [Acidobacteria bacterium]|nr:hypothetical protein [Acidobacteriota bacterium]